MSQPGDRSPAELATPAVTIPDCFQPNARIGDGATETSGSSSGAGTLRLDVAGSVTPGLLFGVIGEPLGRRHGGTERCETAPFALWVGLVVGPLLGGVQTLAAGIRARNDSRSPSNEGVSTVGAVANGGERSGSVEGLTIWVGDAPNLEPARF